MIPTVFGPATSPLSRWKVDSAKKKINPNAKAEDMYDINI